MFSFFKKKPPLPVADHAVTGTPAGTSADQSSGETAAKAAVLPTEATLPAPIPAAAAAARTADPSGLAVPVVNSEFGRTRACTGFNTGERNRRSNAGRHVQQNGSTGDRTHSAHTRNTRCRGSPFRYRTRACVVPLVDTALERQPCGTGARSGSRSSCSATANCRPDGCQSR